MMEETVLRNIVRDSRMVTPDIIITAFYQDLDCQCFSSPRLSFSPESGGSVKPSTAMEAISRQGTIRLEK